MQILAHRGQWRNFEEKNSVSAIRLALENGYGIETDIRDYRGKLVISHNVADESSCDSSDLFEFYAHNNCKSVLALNVKADGIQNMLVEMLGKYGIENYFLFDMSIPELVVNKTMGLRWYTRHSDIETVPVLYDESEGVWFDCFYDDNWMTIDKVDAHIKAGKKVCIVSPELHHKTYDSFWRELKKSGLASNPNVLLCTDIPDEARRYFDE